VLDLKAPITLAGAEERAAERLFSREIEANTRTIIRGSGKGFSALIFARRLSDAKPEPLVPLLRSYPALLAAGDKVETLFRSLRAALGDDQARRKIAAAMTPLGEVAKPDKWRPWPHLCEGGTEADIQAWVFEHVVQALSGKLGGVENAREILVQHSEKLASVSAPEIKTRCLALSSIVGAKAATQIVIKQPVVLTHEASAYTRACDALSAVFGEEVARSRLLERPVFLWSGAEIESLMAQIKRAFPQLAARRLCERTSPSEWSRWPEMVGETGETISKWFGRISAEEKHLESKDRVHAFGS
jgi:hypothetical protein